MKLTKTQQKYILQELIELDNKGLLVTSYYLMNLLSILEKQQKQLKTHCSNCLMNYNDGCYLCPKCGKVTTYRD